MSSPPASSKSPCPKRAFGALAATGCRVTGLAREHDAWRVSVTHIASGERLVHRARFVFVGAGGGSLPLLRSTGLPEARGLGRFPIGGQWLVCDDPALAARHEVKFYGATPPSSPSLGGPHGRLANRGGRDPRALLNHVEITIAGTVPRGADKMQSFNGTAQRLEDPNGFTIWMAGGGMKRGCHYAVTDDFGSKAVEKRIGVNDLHATILLLGIDHEKLASRQNSRGLRDVRSRV